MKMPALQAFARSVFKNREGWTDELSCLNKSGRIIPAEMTASLIDTSEGTCIIALVRDSSERKCLENKLIHAQSELEQRVETRTSELAECRQ